MPIFKPQSNNGSRQNHDYDIQYTDKTFTTGFKVRSTATKTENIRRSSNYRVLGLDFRGRYHVDITEHSEFEVRYLKTHTCPTIASISA